MNKNNEVTFIRKGGRIIPIKRKKGAGSKKVKNAIVGTSFIAAAFGTAAVSGRISGEMQKASKRFIRHGNTLGVSIRKANTKARLNRIMKRAESVANISERFAVRGRKFSFLGAGVGSILAGTGASKIAKSLGVKDELTKEIISTGASGLTYAALLAHHNKISRGIRKRAAYGKVAKRFFSGSGGKLIARLVGRKFGIR